MLKLIQQTLQLRELLRQMNGPSILDIRNEQIGTILHKEFDHMVILHDHCIVKHCLSLFILNVNEVLSLLLVDV
jgi:hypothetical protein